MLFKDTRYILLGFSGLLYGVNAFILLSSVYGKKYMLGLKIGLERNLEVTKIVFVLSTLGFLLSALPRISFSGHLSGFVGGVILFCL